MYKNCRTWGIIILSSIFIWQLYTLYIMVQLHEDLDKGVRYCKYMQLAAATFGILIIMISIDPINYHIFFVEYFSFKNMWFVWYILYHFIILYKSFILLSRYKIFLVWMHTMLFCNCNTWSNIYDHVIYIFILVLNIK